MLELLHSLNQLWRVLLFLIKILYLHVIMRLIHLSVSEPHFVFQEFLVPVWIWDKRGIALRFHNILVYLLISASHVLLVRRNLGRIRWIWWLVFHSHIQLSLMGSSSWVVDRRYLVLTHHSCRKILLWGQEWFTRDKQWLFQHWIMRDKLCHYVQMCQI